jgi:hypothetical protein
VGSNPAQGMDVFPGLTVFCCIVQVDFLRRSDQWSREYYKMSTAIRKSRCIRELESDAGPNRSRLLLLMMIMIMSMG